MTNPTPPRSPRADKYPEILSEIADDFAHAFLELGLPPETVRSLAEHAVERLRLNYGGSLIYIPVGRAFNNKIRNAEIRRCLKAGESRKDIRREYKISDATLDRIEGEEESDPPPICNTSL